MAEQPEQWRSVPTGVACWHIHHEVLLEWTTEPLEARVAYIREYKAQNEGKSKTALRLRLLAPVRGELPTAVVKAGRAYAATWQAYIEANQAWRNTLPTPLQEVREHAVRVRVSAWGVFCIASEAFDEACLEHRTEIEALHAAECPNCPWDGKTIFSEEETDG